MDRSDEAEKTDAGQYIYERKHRKKMAEADIQPADDAGEGIEHDKKEHRRFDDMKAPKTDSSIEKRRKMIRRRHNDRADDPCGEKCDGEKDQQEDRQRFLEGIDDREIAEEAMRADLTHEIGDIPSCHSLEDSGYAEEIVSHRHEDRILIDVVQESPGPDIDRTRVMRLEIVIHDFRELFLRHVVGIVTIGPVYQHERDGKDRSTLEDIAAEILQAACFFVGIKPDQRIGDQGQSEDGKNEDRGEFDQLDQAEKKTGPKDVLPCRVLDESEEKIESENDESGDAEISGDEVVVSQDIGIEGIEGEREKACDRSGHFLGPLEDE